MCENNTFSFASTFQQKINEYVQRYFNVYRYIVLQKLSFHILISEFYLKHEKENIQHTRVPQNRYLHDFQWQYQYLVRWHPSAKIYPIHIVQQTINIHFAQINVMHKFCFCTRSFLNFLHVTYDIVGVVGNEHSTLNMSIMLSFAILFTFIDCVSLEPE